MTTKHQKHAKLIKPQMGEFGRNEISILGTPCGEIKKLAASIAKKLSKKYHIAYVDADHKSADDHSNLDNSALQFGNQLEYVDKIDFHQFNTHGNQNKYLISKQFVDQDLVIVNGNHFDSAKQIVVIDSRKSLEKKLNKLTNVIAIIFMDGENLIPEYLLTHIQNLEDIPQYKINQLNEVAKLFSNVIVTPPLNGLVLAGGKSQRMNKDKGLIEYHGKPQKQFMFDLLNAYCNETYYSINQTQADNDESIQDTFVNLGPYGAILSAFRHNPNAAWIVTACDQPFIDSNVIEKLIKRRNPSKVATAFYNPETDFPEPLVTLWEPKAYGHLLQFLSLGYSCPRKVLINTDIELVKLDDPSVLRNANTPEEYEAAMNELTTN